VITPTEALATIPDELSAVEAAPLMCAGVTTYNALRNSGARDGDLVAILGIGGLGHLGIQFAAKMGFNIVAVGRGKDKEEFVMKLGARQYIDSRSHNAVEELTKLGGAKVTLGTVPSGKAMSAILGGLAVNGKLIVIGASELYLQQGIDLKSGIYVMLFL
jgi:D-arabinose 1-dehydrogenase-like Zn-dependent alcohol dehydrogenase